MENRPLSTSSMRRPSRPALLDDLGLDAGQIIAALLAAVVWLLVCGGAALLAPSAHAQNAAPMVAPAAQGAVPDAGVEVPSEPQVLQAQVQSLLQSQSLPRAQAGQQPWRVEVQLGQLDSRLKLAPCRKVQAYLPASARLWGNTRVGLRCEQGPVRWNVFWPVSVKVWAKALVAAAPLRPGQAIAESDLQVGEVDLAARPSAVLTRAEDVVGRTVARPVDAGHGLRQDDLKVRRWFAAGDVVHLTVKGSGFAVASEGTALTPGDEGQCARIRVESGRTVCGEPVGERLAEVRL